MQQQVHRRAGSADGIIRHPQQQQQQGLCHSSSDGMQLMSRQQQLNRQFFPALLGGQQLPGQQQQPHSSRPRSPDLLFSEKVNPCPHYQHCTATAVLPPASAGVVAVQHTPVTATATCLFSWVCFGRSMVACHMQRLTQKFSMSHMELCILHTLVAVLSAQAPGRPSRPLSAPRSSLLRPASPQHTNRPATASPGRMRSGTLGGMSSSGGGFASRPGSAVSQRPGQYASRLVGLRGNMLL